MTSVNSGSSETAEREKKAIEFYYAQNLNFVKLNFNSHDGFLFKYSVFHSPLAHHYRSKIISSHFFIPT